MINLNSFNLTEMKKCVYLCYIFCCFSFLSHAQKGKDYMLTLQKDTLFGDIFLQRGIDPIVFKHKGLKMNYHPSSIQFFGIFRNNGYQHFKVLRSKQGKAVFVEIMGIGKIYLYKYTEEHIFPNLTLNRYVYLMGESDEKLTTISSSSYQRILGHFFKKNPALLTQLATTSFAEVPKLIYQYNQLDSRIELMKD